MGMAVYLDLIAMPSSDNWSRKVHPNGANQAVAPVWKDQLAPGPASEGLPGFRQPHHALQTLSVMPRSAPLQAATATSTHRRASGVPPMDGFCYRSSVVP